MKGAIVIKITLVFVTCCFSLGINVYANPFSNKQSSKLYYVESPFILESALRNKNSLAQHLQRYSIDAQELETGDTALHFISIQFEQVHRAMENSAESANLSRAKNNYASQKESEHYLFAEYKDKRDLIEYLIVRGASPYIKNKREEKAIDSNGFDLYVHYVLNTHSPDFERKIYKVYLAGPEVFLPFYEKVNRFLKAQVLLFNKYHLEDAYYHIEGLFPMEESSAGAYSDYFQSGTKIYEQNRSLMNSSHAIIANMTRYKGSSMDVGTAYEIGEMVQAKKTVVGYYDDKIYHLHETHTEYKRDLNKANSSAYIEGHDPVNRLLEEIKAPDNLMVIMATLSPHETVKIPTSSWEALFVLKSKLDNRAQ